MGKGGSAVDDRAQQDRKETLQVGLEEMGLVLGVRQQALLLQYLDLLIKWNKAFNLSGVKDPGSMLQRHLLDSLTLMPWMTGQHILDVGTGPGLPGIPLAIAFPDKHFSLLDSNGKKTRFVFQARLELELANVTVHNTRIELYRNEQPVDIIVSRAFSTLADLVAMSRHLLTTNANGLPTRIVAMKGIYPADEIAALPADIRVTRAERVQVPGSEVERHLIELTPEASQNKKGLE